jgi:glycogen debranching enzyme
MIKISFPGISQEQFDEAFAVLEECKAVPSHGFVNPFMGPGGQYGNCWWERDSSLTLNGYCWLDQKFAEDALFNFTLVQKENGRIPLWGNDRVGDLDEELSAIPVIFGAAYRICKRTADKKYVSAIYGMLCRYLYWWLSDIKRDRKTGLVCGIMEESDPSDYTEQLTFAPVDLNVQVCVGADILAEFASYLDLPDDTLKFKKIFYEQRGIINRYLYDETDGFYYTRNVKTGTLLKNRPYNSAFDTFNRRIVPSDRIPALLKVMKDNSKYGYYNKYGITTAPYDSPEFCETVGVYKGWTSWSGNIWTFRNEIIANGLRDCGLYEEAAHIAYQTVMTFNGNYAEFINPSTGAGQGVERYGWSASEYIELIVEFLFGVDYDAWNGKVSVCPNIPPQLYGHTISISGLSVGGGRTLSVSVECDKSPKVTYEIK